MYWLEKTPLRQQNEAHCRVNGLSKAVSEAANHLDQSPN